MCLPRPELAQPDTLLHLITGWSHLALEHLADLSALPYPDAIDEERERQSGQDIHSAKVIQLASY